MERYEGPEINWNKIFFYSLHFDMNQFVSFLTTHPSEDRDNKHFDHIENF